MKISHTLLFILMSFLLKGQTDLDHLVKETIHYMHSFDQELFTHSTSNEVPSLVIFKTGLL